MNPSLKPWLSQAFLAALLLGCSGAHAHTSLSQGSLVSAPGLAAQTAPLQPTIRQCIEAHMGFLASDAMGGRETGTPEGAITAAYVASVMEGMGLQPAGGDGEFTQNYPLRQSQPDLDTLELSFGGSEPLVPFEDYNLRGLTEEPIALKGPVIFAGHGIVDDEAGLDQLAGLNLSGSFVAVLTGVPEGFEDLSSRVNSAAKRDAVAERGALGLILLSAEDDSRAKRSRDWLGRSATRPRMRLDDGVEPEPVLVRLYPEPAVAAALFAAAGRSFTEEVERWEAAPLARGFILDDVTLTLNGNVKVERFSAENVAGLLPGVDDELGQEVIVLSAHMDHVGVNSEGAIHNGADDNASGTAALLAVAEALATRSEPLRRSVLFLSVSGEEKGLLGSEWWVNNPTLPIDAVIANINVDMVGRNDPNSVGITPSPEHEDYNTLVAAAVEAGPAVGLTVGWSAGEGEYRRRVDTYYGRSDHANFAEKGIPVMFLFAGEHEDYHRPSDTLDKIDFDKVAKVSRLVEALVETVAESDERPVALSH
ncbi:MAG: hypothetical protein ACI9EF_000946 [Pseudohongiellaceae bacterium]